jgi:hypothetical protein
MQMIHKYIFVILAIFSMPLTGHAQKNETLAPVQFRAVLHDPKNPVANLFYADKTGTIVPLNFSPQDLTEAMFTVPMNGSLVLYDKAEVDPDNPAASLVASVKLPPNIKRAIVVVLPAPEGKKPAYRMMVIDDSEKAFPKGESRVLPLIGVKTAIQAGEHRISIEPGKICRVPPVRSVSEYNMAQTNFYYREGEAWIVFTERQLQYMDACRRLFIIHTTPGAGSPTVTTIVDIAPESSAP